MSTRAFAFGPIAALLVLGVAGSGAAAPKYPAAVQKRIDDMNQTCSQMGKPAASPGLVTVADLTGDGLPDYIFNEGAFNCDGAASLFSGSGGFQVEVYVGKPGGQASEAFGHGAFGVYLDHDARPAKLYLGVGGVLCGQHVTPDMPRAAYTDCWRPLRWDARARKMKFAPLSEIKPLDAFKQ